jgi:acyl carrier protein
MSNLSYIPSEIKTVIAERVGINESIITDDLSFKMDLEVDSLGFYELIMA